MVNNLAEQDRAMKNERRSQWLSMNHSPAGDVLASLGADMGGLQGQGAPNPAAAVLASTIGAQDSGGLDDALLKRLAEVAIRRVARKRGVAVETPNCETEGKEVTVSVTYVDDGRVLDGPDALSEAFQHAIATEIALKGHEMDVKIVLRRSKDGEVDVVSGAAEEMFACEVCDGLVSENDSTCPHCGAVFEEEDDQDEPAALPLKAAHPVPLAVAPPVQAVAVHPARAKVVLPDRRRAAHLARAKEAPPVQAVAVHPGQRRAVHLAPARAVLPGRRRAVRLAPARAVLPGRRRAVRLAPARAVLPGQRKAAHLAQAKAVLPVRAKVAHPRAAPAVARRRAVQAEVLERAAPLAALQKALAVVLPVAEQRRNRC